MIRLIEARDVERSVDGLPMGTVVVVCDPDADRAASVAGRIVGFRTAVFVGDLSNDDDREAAREFAAETFVKDGEVVF